VPTQHTIYLAQIFLETKLKSAFLEPLIEPKMAYWVGTQGQVTSAIESQKYVLTMTSPTGNPKLKTKFFKVN